MPVRNAPSTIPTTLRLIGHRLLQRWRQRGQGDGVADLSPARLAPVLAALGPGAVEVHRLSVPAGGDWIDSGIDLAPGDTVTLHANGRVWLARALDVGFSATVGLWYRVGDQPLRKVTAAAAPLDVGDGGRLWWVAKPPGEFANRAGDFEAVPERAPLKGGFEVVLLQWRGDGPARLADAARLDAAAFLPVLERLRAPLRPPVGWHYLWRLGDGELYRADPEQANGLCCHTDADVGILQYPVDLPLADDTRLDWSWCVEQLPSALPEHTPPTHDYLSIAVEFDNGLDLTYMWSVSLPVDTVFQCPLPWWDQRETHWVVRSGTSALGQWLPESRSLLADYRHAIGGPLPARVVAVWLIANSAFQRGQGRCRYRGIALHGATGPVRIGADQR